MHPITYWRMNQRPKRMRIRLAVVPVKTLASLSAIHTGSINLREEPDTFVVYSGGHMTRCSSLMASEIMRSVTHPKTMVNREIGICSIFVPI